MSFFGARICQDAGHLEHGSVASFSADFTPSDPIIQLGVPQLEPHAQGPGFAQPDPVPW